MAEQLLDLWRFAPTVLILIVVLGTGHKGWWYWDAGVRRLVDQLERERDTWRAIACALLAKEGIQLPEAFTILDERGPLAKRRDEDDPWKPPR
jgi:hypothetical protein